jgi:hypothetical protein
MVDKNIVTLLDKAQDAIFEVEQAIRRAEGEQVNHCMYKMRLQLAQIKNEYLSSRPICFFVPDVSFEGLAKQHAEELARNERKQ